MREGPLRLRLRAPPAAAHEAADPHRSYPKGALSPRGGGAARRQRGKPGGVVDYAEVMPPFREATWDEALDLVGRSACGDPRRRTGPARSRASARPSARNEEAYLFQKLVRAAFGHQQRRPLHAPVPRVVGRGAARDDRLRRGHDHLRRHRERRRRPDHRHEHDREPPGRGHLLQAGGARAGTKLIVVDPRATDIADHAWRFCQIRSGTDVALLQRA